MGLPERPFPRVNGTIRACLPDCSGGWYIGGGFTKVGEFSRVGLAHILPNGTVDYYWSRNADGAVHTLALSDDGTTLYVGGAFSTVGGQPRACLAALNAETSALLPWAPVVDSAPFFDPPDVDALAVSDSTVYFGGNFDRVAGATRMYLAAVKTDTGSLTDWNPGGDLPFALGVSPDGSTVFTGGRPLWVGDELHSRVAALDAETGNVVWFADAEGAARSLVVEGSTLLAGGRFISIDGHTTAGVIRLNAGTGEVTQWMQEADFTVYGLAASGSTIFAGGPPGFTVGVSDGRLASLDAGTGEILWDLQANGEVFTVAASDSQVYAGGQFSSIGMKPRDHIAALDAYTGVLEHWNPGANGTVRALAVSENGHSVYAAGDFTAIGGEARHWFAALNASTDTAADWNPNPNGPVHAIAVSGSIVAIGGEFGAVGGALRQRIAALDTGTGTAVDWSGLNPGANGPVYSMAFSEDGSTIYFGGSFTTVNGLERRNLGAVDTANGTVTAWNPSPNYSVRCLEFSGGTVYVGGYFTAIGGTERTGIAALDSGTGAISDWDPQIDGEVLSMAVSESAIHIAGGFARVGPRDFSKVAALDIDTAFPQWWNPILRGDPVSSVFCIAVSGQTVSLGGEFTHVGEDSRTDFAQFAPPVPLGTSGLGRACWENLR
jgi:WD40 repeat protein